MAANSSCCMYDLAASCSGMVGVRRRVLLSETLNLLPNLKPLRERFGLKVEIVGF